MTFTLHALGRSVPIIPDGSWTYVSGSFGARMFDNGDGTFALRLSNGAVGRDAPGGFFFDEIWLECPGSPAIYPRVGHSAVDGAVGIGLGADYFPPRAVKIVRFALGTPKERIYDRTPLVARHPHLALPAALVSQKPTYDALGARMLADLASGTPDPGARLNAACGPWMPLGEAQAGAPGGAGIDPYPGWERSPLYQLVSHDLTMERHAVEYVDATTGDPIYSTPQDYRLSRGYGKVTQLAEFCIPRSLQPWDDGRLPKDNNNATCAYRDALLSYQPIDGQHLVRATRHAKAAAFLYGDLCAKFDLWMIAADGFMGTRPGNPAMGQGADMGRSYAWVLDALLAAGMLRHAIRLVTAANRAQTASGSWWYAASQNEEWSGFNPSPWKNLGMPRDQLATHTLETAYMISSMSLANQKAQAERAMMALLAVHPFLGQWVGLMPDLTTYGTPVGNLESFQCWPALGRLATVNPPWRREFINLVPPGGNAPCGPNVRAALIAAGNYEASAKALESLES